MRVSRLAALVSALFLFILPACAPQKEPAPKATKPVAALELPSGLGVYKSDRSYRLVARADLPKYFDDFRDTLFRLGLTKWDSRFDCNKFSALYIQIAQARHAVANWHSDTATESLALGEVWFIQDRTRQAHAIVVAHTDAGEVFIEPQTGKEIELSVRERSSIFFRKY